MKYVPAVLIVAAMVLCAGLAKCTAVARQQMIDNELTVTESMTPAQQDYIECLRSDLGPAGLITISDMHVCAEETDYYGE